MLQQTCNPLKRFAEVTPVAKSYARRMRNNVHEGERKKEIGRLSSAHKIRRPRDSNEYISYRLEICYTLEKRYPGYVCRLPLAHVQQYAPEANQI